MMAMWASIGAPRTVVSGLMAVRGPWSRSWVVGPANSVWTTFSTETGGVTRRLTGTSRSVRVEGSFLMK